MSCLEDIIPQNPYMDTHCIKHVLSPTHYTVFVQCSKFKSTSCLLLLTMICTSAINLNVFTSTVPPTSTDVQHQTFQKYFQKPFSQALSPNHLVLRIGDLQTPFLIPGHHTLGFANGQMLIVLSHYSFAQYYW